MRKYIVIIVLLLVVFAVVKQLGDGEVTQPAQPHSSLELIKAVHYFSSSWPKSFWEDFEASQVDSDFEQIKADGFNTVILVIPWLGFETGFDEDAPKPSVLYERLEWLLNKIDKSGLDYGLRVGFPHNFDADNGIVNDQLCQEIFVDGDLRDNWVSYLSRIAQRVDGYRSSFKFAFFSWEDFFCPYASIPRLPKKQRLDMAIRSGYQQWLAEQFSIDELKASYLQSFKSIDEVPFPLREAPAFEHFLRFVDQFMIDQMLTPGRQVLPELAMEVRVDKDRIHNGNKSSWVGHDLALSDDRMRGSYWGAYYGARNEGELLSADAALRNFETMLNAVSDNGKNTNHIVEQFNFADNTPGYVGRHAQIANDELPAFLEGAAVLLKQKSRGYGLWAYHDYVDSAIYNSSFELGLRGWDTQGQVELITNSDEDQALLMQARSVISQTFAPFERFVELGPSQEVTFCANFRRLAEPAHITLLLDGLAYGELEVSDSGQQCVAMKAQDIKQVEIVFSILSDVEIELDDLRLYSFVQVLNVYDQYGQPGPLRDLIVRLNTEWLGD